MQIVLIVILLYFNRNCPALSQPFTKRVLLDQHIQLMHGVKDSERKTANSDNIEALPDKETVLWQKIYRQTFIWLHVNRFTSSEFHGHF